MSEVQGQIIRQHCKALRMPTIGSQFAGLAEAATREGHSHVGYLEALLAAEMEERESRAIARLLHDARLPRMKTLDAFELVLSQISEADEVVVGTVDWIILRGSRTAALDAAFLSSATGPCGSCA